VKITSIAARGALAGTKMPPACIRIGVVSICPIGGINMETFIELVEMILPPGWAIYGPEMAPDVLLQCPHGHIIEQDGRCLEGCVSPLLKLGLV
jgi:hypothetical protein